MTIEAEKWYRPREIARLRLITNSLDSDKEASNYDFILELIKRGELKARNYSKTEYRKYWLVQGKEITAYHDRIASVQFPLVDTIFLLQWSCVSPFHKFKTGIS